MAPPTLSGYVPAADPRRGFAPPLAPNLRMAHAPRGSRGSPRPVPATPGRPAAWLRASILVFLVGAFLAGIAPGSPGDGAALPFPGGPHGPGTGGPQVAGTGEAGAPSLPAEGDEVVVGTRVVPPFVMDAGDGTYTGLTVHLWDELAEELGVEYRLEERDIEGLLGGVEDGSLFASAAALTITSEREERVDFTHPFFVSGLGIAVADEPAGLGRAILVLFSPDLLWVVFLLVAFLLFWGLLVWVFERKENQEEFGGSRAQGIGSGFWWAAVTMTTVGYGDKAPKTLGGRVVGFAWMFTAIIVISFFTATIASSLTVTRLDTGVTGPEDLPHVRVGALEASAGLAHLDEEGIVARPYPTIPDGLRAVEAGEIDAFVHDAPVLRHYTQDEFRRRARVLPGSFADGYYGIAIPQEADYRNAMNRALLDYLASDEWERFNRRYLGED